MTILSSMRDHNYQQALAVAERTLVPSLRVSVSVFIDEAMHAFNSCAKYNRKGRLKVQGDDIVIINGEQIVKLPAVEQLLLWAELQSVVEFLSRTSGIPVVML